MTRPATIPCPKCGDEDAKRYLLLRSFTWLCPNEACDYFDWDHAVDVSKREIETMADALRIEWDFSGLPEEADVIYQ